jgi:hypothetical protein
MQERRSAGFWVRCAAGLVDLLILAVPLAVFVSFTSVALGISNQFLDLNPGMPPHEVLRRLGPRLVFRDSGVFRGDVVDVFRDF